MRSMVVVLYLQDWSLGTVSEANTPASYINKKPCAAWWLFSICRTGAKGSPKVPPHFKTKDNPTCYYSGTKGRRLEYSLATKRKRIDL